MTNGRCNITNSMFLLLLVALPWLCYVVFDTYKQWEPTHLTHVRTYTLKFTNGMKLLCNTLQICLLKLLYHCSCTERGCGYKNQNFSFLSICWLDHGFAQSWNERAALETDSYRDR